jgi:hypothetical protein
MTPDSYAASAKPSSPQSWNRYAYVIGDPVNHNDPTGHDLGDTLYDNAWESGGTPADISWSGPCGSGTGTAFVDGAQMPSPCDFVPVFYAPPPKPTPSCLDGLNQRDVNYVGNNAAGAYSASQFSGGAMTGAFILGKYILD